jgi:hypothetical protein
MYFNLYIYNCYYVIIIIIIIIESKLFIFDDFK